MYLHSSYDALNVLTFWPPGPEARRNVSSISVSSMLMEAVTAIMAGSLSQERSIGKVSSPYAMMPRIRMFGMILSD